MPEMGFFEVGELRVGQIHGQQRERMTSSIGRKPLW
jgi:hypothetical protein